ncbi:MAG: hypothetical protein AAGH15_10945 [Myxococcota bacterium]
MERLVLWHRVLPPTRLAHEALAASAAWAERCVGALEAIGGERLGRVGASFAVAFDLPELAPALDAALGLLTEAERATDPAGGLPIAFGAATGELSTLGGGTVGSPLQRAELLANRARRGEIALDAATRELAEVRYLFGRSVGAGAAVLRGTTIDRATPHRATCRRALAAVGDPPVAPAVAGALGALDVLTMRGKGIDAVVLRGPAGAGAGTYLAALAADRRPPALLRLAGVPGALEPLGSLRLALLRRWAGPIDLERELDGGGDVLVRVARGEPVARSRVVDALAGLLARWRTQAGQGRPWLLFDPATTVDRATWGVVADVVESTPAFLIARYPIDAPLPGDLARLPLTELVVPALRLDDAKLVARTVLGIGEDDPQEVARRVAILGGDTPLGVVEAARTLVASGDLIPAEGGFRWRMAPRPGIQAIPLEDLYAERLGALEAAPLRMLEAVCLCPPGTPAPVVASVAARDGLDDAERAAALALLVDERLVGREPVPEPSGVLLRRLVLSSMPPGRTAELHRYLADAMEADESYTGSLARATLGWVRGEGDQAAQAAPHLLAAAQGALDAGHRRDAQRLAAAAVQMDPTPEVRQRANELSRGATSQPPTAGSEAPARRAQDAVGALLRGDLEAAERTLDQAIAEGRSLAAADRVRALAHLVRGDMAGAMVALGRARRIGAADPQRRARAALTQSWVLLHAGDASAAVRAGLDGLAAARRLGDPRGEAAALHTLAVCYRALGRDLDAERLGQAAKAAAPAL